MTLHGRVRVAAIGSLLGVALTVAGCASAPTDGTPAATPISPAIAHALADIERSLDQLVAAGITPGAVVRVGTRSTTLLDHAAGTLTGEPHSPAATADTLYDLASLTKPLCTATATLLLLDDGAWSLDQPVAELWPDFAWHDKHAITLRHLLTHTSGLAAYTSVSQLETQYGPRPRSSALVAALADQKLQSATGGRYRYSCLNYLVLAELVQRHAGKHTLETLLRTRVWEPLGLADTTFFPSAEQRRRTAPTRVEGRHSQPGVVHDPLAHYSLEPTWCSGNAGAFSTARDLERWVRFLLADGCTPDGRRLLSEASHRAWTTDQVAQLDGCDRTAGWGIWNDPALSRPIHRTAESRAAGRVCLGHTGYTGTLIWIDRHAGLYLIVLTNVVHPDDDAERKRALIRARRAMITTLLEAWYPTSGDDRAETP